WTSPASCPPPSRRRRRRTRRSRGGAPAASASRRSPRCTCSTATRTSRPPRRSAPSPSATRPRPRPPPSPPGSPRRRKARRRRGRRRRSSCARRSASSTTAMSTRPPLAAPPDPSSPTMMRIFFGPVSRSFIQSGRPSDSGMSEDGNHDITLDSETFSMHYRNIAPPDDFSVNSVGSLRTPNSASTGPLKEQTGSGYGVKSCNSHDALTDMSLLADNPERYDYAKLSPTLSNLLQQVEDVHELISPKNGTGTVTPDHSSALAACKKKNREEKSSIVNGISSSELDTIGSREEHVPIRNSVPTSTDPIQEDNAMTVDVNEKSQVTSEDIPNTPKAVVQTFQIPQGSISSLRSKRRQLFSPITLSASNVVSQDASSLGSEFVKHSKRIVALADRLKFGLYESPATKIQEMPCNALMTDDQPSHECNSIQDSDLDRGGRKRSSSENGHAAQKRPQKISKPPRSPATSLKQLPCVSLSSSMMEENQSVTHGNQQSINVDWNKVASMVSNATSQVFSTSISKVKPQQLDMIEDMLGGIQRARNFKRLSTAVRIQDCGNDKQKRLAEARSLVDKLLYEKAKLQINHVKLEKLQNRAQVCKDGIQECRYLKSKISDQKGVPLDSTTLITASDRQEGLALITEKMHALDMIKKKVERARSSLEFFCNTKGDISCDDFIKAAEQQLEMRNQCRIINQQARLWKLNDLVKRENKRDIVLNYCSLLFQRIVLNISDMSGIFVSNSLNGTKIGQAFPNLNASVAFNFVFKAEGTHRVSDLRSLQKMTTETSLLLGNLIDVLKEIKMAKLELLNLTAAAFDMASQTCQLALSLCFMSFKSGKRISFTIDMTDLNRAVYPSELLINVREAQTTVAQPSLDEFMSSLRDLQSGRLMILRLCRMGSQLIHELPS
uniref:Knl1 C-terminal RWD domain-containing protein n=1 Tax=Oryza glaberrima TaxID=4538 RepID=I1Q3J0_ORYGL